MYAPIVTSTGLTGATQSCRIVGSTTAGAPTAGNFQKGDLVPSQDGHLYICTTAGSPGLWSDASVAPIQSASSITLTGDLHLTTAGNAMEQGSVLTLKSSVSNPNIAPTLSSVVHGSGSIVHNGPGWYAFACYTWIDGSGHESAPSPVSLLYPIQDTRGISGVTASVAIGIPALPTGVTGFRVYAIEQSGTIVPAASTLKRQAAPTYISSETSTTTTWTAYNSSGANPPGSSTFPAGTAAKIVDANGGSLISGTGAIQSANRTAGVGYATGAGSAVTQLTNKATAVTLNAVTGTITTHNANLAANTRVEFNVSNSTVSANDTVLVTLQSAGITDAYDVSAVNITNTAFIMRIFNWGTFPLAETLLINFAVIKAVNS